MIQICLAIFIIITAIIISVMFVKGVLIWRDVMVKQNKRRQEEAEKLPKNDIVGQSEQLVCKCGLPKNQKGSGFSCLRTDCNMPIAN